MSAVQMFGTLLAIPLGIGSAYTMYRANFAPETTCQSLRASIVSLLDKGVDARTRHMLVRRDVIAFEKNCGSFDPDATAAFKSLLASDGAAPRRVEAKPPEAAPKDIAHKAEAKPDSPVKKAAIAPAAKPASQEGASAPQEMLTDAAWLAAVRGALTPDAKSSDADVKPATTEAAAAREAPVAAAPRPAREPRPLGELRVTAPAAAPAVPAPPPATSQAAPALPPPEIVATVPQQADPEHPVPPAAIPETVETRREPSRLGSLVEQIPFVGQILAK